MWKPLKRLVYRLAIGFVPACACGKEATLRYHVRGSDAPESFRDCGVLFGCGEHAPDAHPVWYAMDPEEAKRRGYVR